VAQSVYKVNTTDSLFAYLSEDQTRTIIAASGMEGGRENLPGVAYMHNVVPTERGLQVVTYENLSEAAPGLTGNMIDVRIIYSLQRNRHYFCFTDDGAVYRLDDTVTPAIWVLISAAPTPGSNLYDVNKLSLGRVNGVTYVYYPQQIPDVGNGNANASYYDEDTDSFIPQELVGAAWELIIGIAASSGYLIAYSVFGTQWSSTIDPTDFITSQETGAGGGDVAGIAGNVLFCHANTLGLLFYTDNNIIAATYTGNVQYPFKFREVESSKGGISHETIAYEANNDPQFTYTKGGIQSITSRKAETMLPDLADFLAGRRIETLDTETWEYSRENLLPDESMKVAVKYISSRYLLFSYGVDSLTHAILWDTTLEKVGKLLVPHTDIFEYTGEQQDVAKATIAVIRADGVVKLVHSATDSHSVQNKDVGVVVFGKLQATRTRMMTLLGIEFEGEGQFAENVECVDLSSLTGARNFEITEGVQAPNSPAEVYRNYFFKKAAKNHNIAVLGRFGIDTFLVTYTINGRR
jgi:hypothetical protein